MMKPLLNRFLPALLLTASLSCSTALLSGCAGQGIEGRIDQATHIAKSSNMQPIQLKTGRHILAGWVKYQNPLMPTTIYIEGDGHARLSRREPSLNPTPKNPMALKLSALDPAPNVIYLARPCQFTEFDKTNNNCQTRDWTNERFSAEIIDEYMSALDQIKQKYSAEHFHLIGYSGGGNVAGLLTARRSDILSLRTVAGNIDNDYFTNHHDVSPMPNSLNMANDVDRISQIPQIHFVGLSDKVIPLTLGQHYKDSAKDNSCISIHPINGVNHGEGWKNIWATLLNIPLPCPAK